MFRNRLVKIEKHLRKLASKQGVSCYRLYDHDLPEFPLCLDRYEDHLHIAEYKRRHGMDEQAHAYWLQEVIHAVGETIHIPLENIHYKVRQRKTGRQGQYQKKRGSRSPFF